MKTETQKISWEQDGSQMALIPSGSFEMGDHFNEQNDAQVHKVELSDFYMDVHPVTVRQFRNFVKVTKYKFTRWDDVEKHSPDDSHPMVYVSWYDAVRYAKWVGKRLPTEAEWEYAARGGLVGQRFPVGNRVSHDDANYQGTGGLDTWDQQTSPVKSFAPNAYGLYDTAGNVCEWCGDWYGTNYYQKASEKNPNGPANGKLRVLRGGSWTDEVADLQVAKRNRGNPNAPNPHHGFRCVADTESVSESQIAITSTEVELDKRVWKTDGAEVVLLPAGEFLMGEHFNEGEPSELPIHTVQLDAFFMDIHPVSVGRFKKFMEATKYKTRPMKFEGWWGDSLTMNQYWDKVTEFAATPDHPMVMVDWFDAIEYAQWAGKRLPTEAEWEYAARGGLVGKRYPWQDEITPEDASFYSDTGKDGIQPVGNSRTNRYGLLDIVGNIWEWCLDAYEERFYTKSPKRCPIAGHEDAKDVIYNFKQVDTNRVLRGGAWVNDAYYLRVSCRESGYPSSTMNHRGFRCVIDVDSHGDPKLLPNNKKWNRPR